MMGIETHRTCSSLKHVGWFQGAPRPNSAPSVSLLHLAILKQVQDNEKRPWTERILNNPGIETEIGTKQKKKKNIMLRIDENGVIVSVVNDIIDLKLTCWS
jgi:hypothetical protein